MSKSKTLFDKELTRTGFGARYYREKTEYGLELQILNALVVSGYTYEQFAQKIGSSKGNVSRDLKIRGLGKASMERIQKMADALGLEFVPLLLPKDEIMRRERVKEIFANERKRNKRKNRTA